MRAAIDGVDVVGKTENRFRIGVVVLEGDLDVHVFFVGFHVDGLVVERLLAAVQVLDELGDAAVVLELGTLGFAGLGIGLALVGQRDDEALVQEREFAQTLRERVEVVFDGGGENSFVGHEVNLRACLYFGGAGFSQFAGGLAFRVRLLPGETVAPDFEIEFFAQRVDAAHADAVQSSGNFVGVAVELAARVQRGHHDLRGGNFFAVDVHVVDGNAASVVDYGDGVIEVDGHFDLVGVAGEGLVNRVVDDFVHQVMQPKFAGRADVHGGTFAHRLHAAEDLDRVGGVFSVGDLAVLVLGVDALRVDDFGLQFFRSHSAPWRTPDRAPDWRDDSGTARVTSTY